MEMNIELTDTTARVIELELRHLELVTRKGHVEVTMEDVNARVRELRKDFQIMLELLGASVRNDAFEPYPKE